MTEPLQSSGWLRSAQLNIVDRLPEIVVEVQLEVDENLLDCVEMCLFIHASRMVKT